jgi:hypothetical protein
MVAEDGKCGEAPFRKVLVDLSHLLEHASVITDEVAGYDDDIWSKLSDPPKRPDNVLVVDPGTYVYVANLNQRAASQTWR